MQTGPTIIERYAAAARGFEPRMLRALEVILEKGCLARRILSALEGDERPQKIYEIYRRLCHCLERGEMFL